MQLHVSALCLGPLYFNSLDNFEKCVFSLPEIEQKLFACAACSLSTVPILSDIPTEKSDAS